MYSRPPGRPSPCGLQLLLRLTDRDLNPRCRPRHATSGGVSISSTTGTGETRNRVLLLSRSSVGTPVIWSRGCRTMHYGSPGRISPCRHRSPIWPRWEECWKSTGRGCCRCSAGASTLPHRCGRHFAGHLLAGPAPLAAVQGPGPHDALRLALPSGPGLPDRGVAAANRAGRDQEMPLPEHSSVLMVGGHPSLRHKPERGGGARRTGTANATGSGPAEAK